MLNKHYQVYINNVFTLAKSIMLKSDYTAQKFNDLMLMKHGDGFFNPNDKTTWKYYLNICGEYHSTDKPIIVNSFDNHESIEFTKANLDIHLSTKHEYRVGTKFHDELISLHPEQEILIRGVLTPLEMDYAIACEEFTIVSYANDCVEANEYTLMNEVQSFIKKHSARYHNRQFTISEDMYYGTYLATLMMYCVMCIMNYRLKMCKTSEAHSFHVTQYLNSYSKIGEHYQNLSHDQRMFFMRNIRYIERQTGIKENFDWLRTNLMDAINMPLASFEIRHDLSGMPESISPEIVVKKVPINTKLNVDGIDNYTLTDILDLTDSLGSLNSSMRATEEIDFKRKSQHAINNSTTIKLLESTTLSNEGGEQYPMQDILLHHWLHLSAIDVYKAKVDVRISSSGLMLNLTAKDAFILFIYSYSHSLNKTLIKVPPLIAFRVIHNEKPSFDDLRALAESDVVNDAQVQELLDEVPVMFTEIHSVSAFNDYCDKLFKMANLHASRVALKPSIKERPQYYNVSSRLWGDSRIDNLYDKTYKDWFEENDISLDSLTTEDLDTIWKDIFQAATGTSIDKQNSLQSVQSSVTRLFMQLSSYSIQLVGNVKNASAFKVGLSSIRYGSLTANANERIKINASSILISNVVVDRTAYLFDKLNASGGVKISYSVMYENCSIPNKLLLDQIPSNVKIDIEQNNKYQVISKILHNVNVVYNTTTQIDDDLI